MTELKLTSKNAFLQAREQARQHWGGIEHRMEWLGEWNGVGFMNDSKATDIESVVYTFENITQPVIWICGNSEDSDKFWALEKNIKYKVWAAFGFGEWNQWDPTFKGWVDEFKNYTRLEDAFTAAVEKAQPGTLVLLSPGNASYDMYSNFKERGAHFKDLFAKLK